nr:hypothetical protein Itr_chr07CG04760 [Ipomoea trifida]
MRKLLDVSPSIVTPKESEIGVFWGIDASKGSNGLPNPSIPQNRWGNTTADGLNRRDILGGDMEEVSEHIILSILATKNGNSFDFCDGIGLIFHCLVAHFCSLLATEQIGIQISEQKGIPKQLLFLGLGKWEEKEV